MFPELDESFAEASVRRAIELHQPELKLAIKASLSRRLESAPTGYSIVCGLWTARSLRATLGKTLPMFYVHAGVEGRHLYDDADSLATNARFKASPCAQTGLDTKLMEKEPHHWLAVEGYCYPFGGAIFSSIDPVDFVVATSGLDTGDEDHDVSEDVWKLVTDFACRSNREDLRRANLPAWDPRHLKYLRNERPEAAVSNPGNNGDIPSTEDHLRIPEGQVSSWRDASPHD